MVSHEVSVPRHRLSTYGRRAFAVAGPTVWNSLPEDMRDPDVSEDSYRQSLKTLLFSQYKCVQRIRDFFYENALYKFTFDIDIDIDCQYNFCSRTHRLATIHPVQTTTDDRQTATDATL